MSAAAGFGIASSSPIPTSIRTLRSAGAHSNSTPLFGAGLIEAIPDGTVLGNQSNGGRPNYVLNPDTGATELGRFGWKAQVATLHQFAGDAYLNELGVTNPSFPHENRPQGEPIPPGCDTVGDNEDDGSGVTAFANFMRFLAPAPRGAIMRPSYW